MENTENKEREKNKLLPSYYYIEGKSIVFTKDYHKDRGYCCGSINGCRHCPYDPKGVKGNTTLVEK